MEKTVIRRKKVEPSPQAEEKPDWKIKIAFYLPKGSAETLEEIRLHLLRQGRTRRDASQSNLVVEAIGLLGKKYLEKEV